MLKRVLSIILASLVVCILGGDIQIPFEEQETFSSRDRMFYPVDPNENVTYTLILCEGNVQWSLNDATTGEPDYTVSWNPTERPTQTYTSYLYYDRATAFNVYSKVEPVEEEEFSFQIFAHTTPVTDLLPQWPEKFSDTFVTLRNKKNSDNKYYTFSFKINHISGITADYEFFFGEGEKLESWVLSTACGVRAALEPLENGEDASSDDDPYGLTIEVFEGYHKGELYISKEIIGGLGRKRRKRQEKRLMCYFHAKKK
ncbi:hypothetical protein QOT17_025079 [Balamuthia mandrillaris]